MACSKQLQEKVPKDKLLEYWKMFNKVDQNKDGRITRPELEMILENCEKTVKKPHDMGQLISFNDFIHLMESSNDEAKKQQVSVDGDDDTDEELEEDSSEESCGEETSETDSESEDQLELIFNTIDKDGSGQISKEKVIQFLRDQGQDITEEVLKEIEETDINGDGKIDLEEFKTLAQRGKKNVS